MSELCEHCRKHARSACGSSCLHCLQPGKLLMTCGSCKSIRYCSKTCQKADWKEGHKLICRSASNLRDIRERYGEEIELKHKSFEAWCTETGSFSHAAISALGLHSDWKRIDNYVFLVEVETTTTVFKSPSAGDGANAKLKLKFTHAIISARCASMEEMHALMDWRFPGTGAITTERNLAHRPGLMRIYFTNNSLPFPLDGYTTPMEVRPANLLARPYDSNWLKVLRSRVDMPAPSGGITGAEGIVALNKTCR